MNFLKKHWGNIIAIGGPLLTFLLPSIQSFASDNPKTALGVLCATFVVLFNSRAPKDKASN